MNYYIQGCAAKADKIKAAFEAKGISDGGNSFIHSNYLYFSEGGEVDFCGIGGHIANLIKTHPDYKELELPIEFKDGDIIGFNDCTHNDGSYIDWIGIYKQASETNQHLFHCVIPSCRSFRVGGLWRVFTAYPATKEQRELLFAKIKEEGYEWDEKKKELRKTIEPKFKVGDNIKTGNTIETIAEIGYATRSYYCESGRTISFANQDLWHLAPKSHYDIANFKAGMPVLVRDYDNSHWSYVQFSHYVGECRMKFNACGIPYIQCIPFNDDTKHLLGTTDPCDEQYINW